MEHQQGEAVHNFWLDDVDNTVCSSRFHHPSDVISPSHGDLVSGLPIPSHSGDVGHLSTHDVHSIGEDQLSSFFAYSNDLHQSLPECDNKTHSYDNNDDFKDRVHDSIADVLLSLKNVVVRPNSQPQLTSSYQSCIDVHATNYACVPASETPHTSSTHASLYNIQPMHAENMDMWPPKQQQQQSPELLCSNYSPQCYSNCVSYSNQSTGTHSTMLLADQSPMWPSTYHCSPELTNRLESVKSGPETGSEESDSEERLNVCHLCGKAYARPSTLKTHLRTHSGERPYRCFECSKSFSQAANLTAHLRTHSGEKPFRCPVCHRRFSQSSSVTTHMRTHSGERPYRCCMCKKAFSDSSTLTKHLRIHSGEKPYQCKMCFLRFSQSGNLNRHMRVHAATNHTSSFTSASRSVDY